MTTLAKIFLDGEVLSDVKNKNLAQCQEWADAFVRKRLTYPLPGASDLEATVAERFVFEVDAPKFVDDLMVAGSVTWRTIHDTVTLPDAPIWVEYPMTFADGAPGKMGFMIDTVMNTHALEAPAIAIVIVGMTDRTAAIPIAFTTIEEFPYHEGTKMMPVFYMDKIGETMGGEGIDSLLAYLKEICCCLFLLQTPKVVELRKSEFGPRKAKVAARTGKPFVELHRVSICIGIPEPRYERSGEGASGTGREGGVKYHRVMPHFRTYGRQVGKPRAKLIDSFWRGDPKKGIVIHERHVKLGAKNDDTKSGGGPGPSVQQ